MYTSSQAVQGLERGRRFRLFIFLFKGRSDLDLLPGLYCGIHWISIPWGWRGLADGHSSLISGFRSRFLERVLCVSWKTGNLVWVDLLEISDPDLIGSLLSKPIGSEFGSSPLSLVLTLESIFDFGVATSRFWEQGYAAQGSAFIATLEGAFLGSSIILSEIYQGTLGLFESEGTWWCRPTGGRSGLLSARSLPVVSSPVKKKKSLGCICGHCLGQACASVSGWPVSRGRHVLFVSGWNGTQMVTGGTQWAMRNDGSRRP